MFLDIVITLLLVLSNGFFVAAEFAIVKVRVSQLELKVQEKNPFAILAKHIVSRLDGYLAATQLGVTLSSLGLGWIGEPVVSKIILNIMHIAGIVPDAELAHHIALPVAFLFITIMHIVFGELAPKSIAIQRSEQTTLFIAYPLQFFFILFRPFIWLLNGIANLILKTIGITAVHGADVHSSEELKYLVQQGRQSGRIDASEYKIIRNAFDFSEQTARQVMVPRVKVFAIDLNEFNDEMIDRIIEENFSRVPCYDGNLDKIVGVVYLKDILLALRRGEKPEIRNIMRPMHVVPYSKSIGQILNEFQVRHQQMALVVNEYGGTEGIITMEDILEELVGEIQDEYDNEIPIVEKVGEKAYRVWATATIDDINDQLPFPLPKDEQYQTLAGYLIYKLGCVPVAKEKIILDNYEYYILKRNSSTVLLVLLTVLSD